MSTFKSRMFSSRATLVWYMITLALLAVLSLFVSVHPIAPLLIFCAVAILFGLFIWIQSKRFALAWNFVVYGFIPPAFIIAIANANAYGPFGLIPLLFLLVIFLMFMERDLKRPPP